MDITKKENFQIGNRKKRKRNLNSKNIFSMYKSEKTLKDYMFYLNKFLNFVYEGNGEFHKDEIVRLMTEVEKEDIEDYVYHLIEERELKNTSVNKIISSLKSLYNELEKHGHENPLKFVPLLKVSRHNFENVLKVSFSEIKEILKKHEVLDDKSYRNRIIVHTLFYTGMRSQELLNLKYSDIIKREKEYVIKLEKTKSGREQYKALHPECMEKIFSYKKYIKKLYSLSDSQLEEQYIFPSDFLNNTRLSYSSLYTIIQNMGKLIEKDISPHNIRHAVATELSLQGADIMEIRDFLGHADTKVTEVYINAKGLLEKRAIEKLPALD
ncbi:tyrosine-type recombinase/integrase [Ilyobacter polytropus]|uniref:Integrase family protein n=1 Tax=Ilyobacter polytropus (strain ATCC 51220 / DSM 2926 / LMG 16218 / CuHBu1) TaxID=572544 RepID=E3H8E7_ILYPC|nr:site-specific integrase [Ilyobacter polytropus]ADO82714.1 integrase family protein [Ilyobacter polytropus DSM 2926]